MWFRRRPHMKLSSALDSDCNVLVLVKYISCSVAAGTNMQSDAAVSAGQCQSAWGPGTPIEVGGLTCLTCYCARSNHSPRSKGDTANVVAFLMHSDFPG